MMDISPLFKSSEEVTTPEEALFEGPTNLPSWLEGDFLQIGPGLWDLSPTVSLNHFLDGYAILSRFSLSPSTASEDVKASPSTTPNTNSKVSFSSHYIRSEAYKKALETGAPQYTEFGTCSQEWGDRGGGVGFLSKMVASISSLMKEDLSDNASSSLFQIGAHCCASAPTCFFYELELQSDVNPTPTGQRYDGKRILGQNGLGTHPLVDEDGTWWNMGFTVLPTLKHNILTVPGVGRGGGGEEPGNLTNFFTKGKIHASIPSRWNGALALNHSFGMSKSYIIFVEQPLVVRVSRVLSSKLRGYSVKDWLDWRPENRNKFHLVDKVSGERVGRNVNIISEQPFFFLHFLNCYEDEERGVLVIDINTSPNPSAMEATLLEKLRRNDLSPELGLDMKIQRFLIPLRALRASSFRKFPENQNILDFDQNQGQEGGQGQSQTQSQSRMGMKGPSAYRHGSNLILRPVDLTPSGVDQMSLNPIWRGRRYSYFYGGGSFLSKFNSEVATATPFAHSVVKVDLDQGRVVGRWFESRRHFPGEPVFVPRPVQGRENERVDEDEDVGVVLVAVRTLPHKGSDEEQMDNFLLVLDAKSFAQVGRAVFKSKFPAAVHAMFKKNLV